MLSKEIKLLVTAYPFNELEKNNQNDTIPATSYASFK